MYDVIFSISEVTVSTPCICIRQCHIFASYIQEDAKAVAHKQQFSMLELHTFPLGYIYIQCRKVLSDEVVLSTVWCCTRVQAKMPREINKHWEWTLTSDGNITITQQYQRKTMQLCVLHIKYIKCNLSSLPNKAMNCGLWQGSWQKYVVQLYRHSPSEVLETRLN